MSGTRPPQSLPLERTDNPSKTDSEQPLISPTLPSPSCLARDTDTIRKDSSTPVLPSKRHRTGSVLTPQSDLRRLEPREGTKGSGISCHRVGPTFPWNPH